MKYIENEMMLPTNEFSSKLTTPGQLLDHRTVEWKQVLRVHYWMEQSFEYTYPGPIRDLRQRLIVVPPDHYGDQRLGSYTLHVTAPLATTTTEIDAFGNRILRTYIPYVDERVAFDIKMRIERDFENANIQHVSAEDAEQFRQSTHLTTPDTQIMANAKRFLEQFSEATRSADVAEMFAEAVNTWIYSTMRYGRGATTVDTTAAEALELGQGLCQDYAHIMLAVCRAAGLAVRYVSGHLLGEGRSHAWVELLLPDDEGGYRAIAFDPTNHRRTTPAYLTIAVGRDYSDVSPTSGSFIAPFPGHLNTTKRAGITHLELCQLAG